MSELFYAKVEAVDNEDPRPGDLRESKWVVTEVLVLPPEQKGTGEKYLTEELGLSGQWYRTELDTGFRKQLASIGGEFIPASEAPETYPDGLFVQLKSFPFYVLNDNYDWVPPEEKPAEDAGENKKWIWAGDVDNPDNPGEWVKVDWDYAVDLPVFNEEE
tara:strand:+ start:1412 stop:1891 length:480 start_codon:yes stop_codon:yes gene_type:complete